MTDELRIALQFKHESKEFFDASFVAADGDEARAKCEELLVVLRAKAAARAMESLIHRGWFHGQILSGVNSYENGDVHVRVALVNYGEMNPLAETKMAVCHPDKPEYCGGYCEDCFGG